MNNLNLTHDEYWEKYPVDEATPEDYDIPKECQITFTYPKVLRECRMGETISFYTDGVSTYFETSGEWTNAGLFKFWNKVYTDMELYEFVYNLFIIQHKEMDELG